MRAETLLDAVALAYADDPRTLDVLLVDLAEALAHRDHAAASPYATDYGREVAAAVADAAREDLLGALDLPADDSGVMP